MNKKILSLALCSLFSIGAALALPVAQDQAAPPPPPQGDAQQPGPDHGRGRQMDPEKQLAHLTKALNLTADQQTQIKPILADRQQKMQALWSDSSLSREDRMSKMKSIREDSNTKIEAVLTADQKPKYEQMQQRGRGPQHPEPQ
jgi:Spy/CpxP family protein refolding chaperone